MQHRHLNHDRLTLAAIDDLIARGRWDDWADLRRAALADRQVLERVRRICQARVVDPQAPRYLENGPRPASRADSREPGRMTPKEHSSANERKYTLMNFLGVLGALA